MYLVYVLKDETGRLYKGMTTNLEQRLADHRRGHTRSTKKLKNIKVVYLEELPNLTKALKREKYLKSAAGRRFLKNTLHEGP